MEFRNSLGCAKLSTVQSMMNHWLHVNALMTNIMNISTQMTPVNQRTENQSSREQHSVNL